MAPVLPLAAARLRQPEHAGLSDHLPDWERRLCDHLLGAGTVSPEALVQALGDRACMDVGLGELLLAQGTIGRADLDAALLHLFDAGRADFDAFPADPRLIDAVGPARCLRLGLLPWRRIGGATVVATCRPDGFDAAVDALPKALQPAIMALCSEAELEQALLRQRGAALAHAAETRVPAEESCRFWQASRARAVALAGLVMLALSALFAPLGTLAVLTAWGAAWMLLGTALKLAALLAEVQATRRVRAEPEIASIARRPVVSILVPLYHETELAACLIDRLSRLDYPRALLDICLVTEADDQRTRDMLEDMTLPGWMRCVSVPDGLPKTKPRALNYALDFCHGSIVGVYDAEDAPAPDQIAKVVERFQARGADVACLQGGLDFYNTRENWLARCFTAEYAGWFRVVLPGMARLGLPVPLGGTTLFFRRAALEALGGWDAHNVTEDADLGLRLVRHGYRVEFIDSVTGEEAACHPWPWVRQRSRWLKGYALTWATHMRNPVRLWRQLGGWGFAGVQVLFVGTLTQFALAPLMWSFWSVALGYGHPLGAVVPHGALIALIVLFLCAEAVNLGVGALGLVRAGKTRLIPWLPSLHLYFPLASVAAYKAVWEMASHPFFWDKTRHGVRSRPEEDAEARWIIAKVRAGLGRDAGPVTPLEKAPPHRDADAPRTRSRYGS